MMSLHTMKNSARWALTPLLCASLIACDDEPSSGEGGVEGGAVAGQMAGQVMAGVDGGGGAMGAAEAGVMGGEAGVMGGEAGVMTGGVAGGAGVMAGAEASCFGTETYGLLSAPEALDLSGGGMMSAAQLALLPEGGSILTWLGTGEQGDNYLSLQRLDAEGAPQGDVQVFGRVKGGQYRLHTTSTGSVVIWINQRSELLTSEAIYLQAFDLMGAPRSEAPVEVSGTFGASYIASAWEDAFGGLLMIGDSTGLTARLFSLDGVADAGAQVASGAVRNPTLVFGGASWGALWSTREEGGAVSLHFRSLNESGEPVGELKTWEETRAQGAAKLAYGNGSYAMAWSAPDPSVIGGQGRLIVNLRLMDETGAELGAFMLNEGEGSMQLSSLAWLSPSVFMAVWHGGGAEGSSVGLSRVNNQGQVLAPVVYSPASGELFAEAKVVGASSSAQLIMTIDPSPQPTGLFSAETRISVTPVGPCE